MANIITRADKGSPLTNDEVDSNFINLDENKIEQTAADGAAIMPVGPTSTRPDPALEGHFRRNDEMKQWEGFDGNSWGSLGGASGGGGNPIIYENDQIATADYDITQDRHGMTAGPFAIADDVTVRVPDGSVWTIVSGAAAGTPYDNMQSGLAANNMQDAMDEIVVRVEDTDNLIGSWTATFQLELDDRYTKAEADSRFLRLSGGNVTGAIGVGTGASPGTSTTGVALTNAGTVELFGGSPFIDFKNTNVDHQFRIIQSDSNSLNIVAANGSGLRVQSDGNVTTDNSLFINGAQHGSGTAATRRDYVDGIVSQRISGDSCFVAGFAGNNVDEPYMRHHGSQIVVPVMRSSANTGRLGMTTTHSADFHWNNGFYYRVDGNSWQLIGASASDAKFKEIDKECDGLKIVLQLKPSHFKYKQDTPLRLDDKARNGFIAQELQTLLPELVQEVGMPYTKVNADDARTQSEEVFLAYAQDADKQLIAILVRATQELSAKLDDALARIEQLEAK